MGKMIINSGFKVAPPPLHCTSNAGFEGFLKRRRYQFIPHLKRRAAFTLAEVLITLAILGVVAAMTIPTLIAHNQEKGWNTSDYVFQRKLGEALKIMNAHQTLAGWNNTQDFVNELSKHMKILKTCSSTSDCFAKEIFIDDQTIDMSKIKKAKHLYSANDYHTDAIGVMFASGINGVIAYNPQCKSDPFSNDAIQITGDINKKGNNVQLSTACLSILYDVNGFSKPNKFTTGGKLFDVRGINVSLNIPTCIGGYCYSYAMQNYEPLDCSNNAKNSADPEIRNAYNTYCGPTPSGWNPDYWAGAKKHCADIGMHVPEENELIAFFEEYIRLIGGKYADVSNPVFPREQRYCAYNQSTLNPTWYGRSVLITGLHTTKAVGGEFHKIRSGTFLVCLE